MSWRSASEGLSALCTDTPLTSATASLGLEMSLCGYGKKGQRPPLLSPQAEKMFMVARGLVREAREDVEAHQAKLKEVRDRLDRISREDNRYLELATQEHRMLQVGTSGGSPSSPGQVMEGCGGNLDWSGGQRPDEEANQKPHLEGLGPRLPEPIHPPPSRVLEPA